MLTLMETTYNGFSYPKSVGKVAYLILDKEVFFVGLTGPEQSTTTINAAEAVVSAISQAAKLDWRDHIFYDIQTCLGYYMEPDEFHIDRLEIEARSDQPWVTAWISIDESQLPPEVAQAFKPLIA